MSQGGGWREDAIIELDGSGSMFLFVRFGVFLASVGRVNPNSGVAFYSLVENRAFCFQTYMHFMNKILVQVGQCFPHISAVYFRCRCAGFERDGSDLMFR